MAVIRLPPSGVVNPRTWPKPWPKVPARWGVDVLKDPPWIRTKGSSWISAFRILTVGNYKKFGYIPSPQLHLSFWKQPGHKHAYQVSMNVIRSFMAAQSKGKFVHRVLLGAGWNNKNKQCRYNNWPITF